MPKFFWLLCLLFATTVVSYAQTPVSPDTSWKKGGFFALNANQVSLYNWAAGGDNAVSVTGIINAFANYKKDKTTWDNSLDMGYGVITTGKKLDQIDSKSWRKNEDRFEINSKFGRLAKGQFFYSGMANFRTQFAPGYSDLAQTDKTSDFMAPAYLTIALGMDWKPADYFSLFVSPATGKYTFVMNQTLADAGAFGVEGAKYDALGLKIANGKKFRPEFGASLVAKFQKDIMKNVNLKTGVTFFNNYTDKNTANRQNIDVNWDLTITMKVNKYISASIMTLLIYDHDITIKDVDAFGVTTGQGPRTQYKQVIGVGFSYKF
jgi:hypothetical protein